MFLPLAEATPKHAMLFFPERPRNKFHFVLIDSTQQEGQSSRNEIPLNTFRFLNFKMRSCKISGLGSIAAVIILVLTYLLRKIIFFKSPWPVCYLP